MNLDATSLALLCCLIFAAAAIYTSVGHAGASGYVAAMALFGLAPVIMRPTALTLNVLVASLATVRLERAKLVNWRALWPLLAGSIPSAFLGGALQVPGQLYRTLVGFVLIIAALKLLIQPRDPGKPEGSIPTSIPVLPA